MIADTDVSNCLATLLGTEVATRETPANKPAIALTQPGLAAIYIDDEKKVRGVCLCDVPVAAYSGAAMTLVGVEAADDVLVQRERDKGELG
jgi:chloramphenicol 3-O-phosphotransferase